MHAVMERELEKIQKNTAAVVAHVSVPEEAKKEISTSVDVSLTEQPHHMYIRTYIHIPYHERRMHVRMYVRTHVHPPCMVDPTVFMYLVLAVVILSQGCLLLLCMNAGLPIEV